MGVRPLSARRRAASGDVLALAKGMPCFSCFAFLRGFGLLRFWRMWTDQLVEAWSLDASGRRAFVLGM